MDHTSHATLSSFIHPHTLCIHVLIVLSISKRRGVLWHCSTYWVRTAGHFARFTPNSDFFHHTFCTVHTVHIVCSPFTLVVNPLLITIVHHIFSSVLAEPHLYATYDLTRLMKRDQLIAKFFRTLISVLVLNCVTSWIDWDDLVPSYTLNHNLVHTFIPNFSFKGTVTRPRSSFT